MHPKLPKPTSAKELRRGDLGGLRCGVYGPGRVGSSLVRWCRDAGAELRLVVSRRKDLPAALAGLGAPGPVPPGELDLRRAELDLLLLTVSDPALEECATRLAARLGDGPEGIPEESPRDATDSRLPVVLHASGCRDASALAPLASAGVAVGSLHPLRAFPGFVPAPDPSTVYAVDGSPAALRLARRLVDAWDGRAVELDGERRAVYHLAASLAAGGVTTVLAVVGELTREADLPPELADDLFAGYLSLLRGAVDGAEEVAESGGPEAVPAAITGPAARGDEDTLERHRRALRSLAPELGPTVEALWRETVRQVARTAGGEREDDGDDDGGSR